MCELCKEEERIRTKKYREEKKQKVIDAYGGGCECCGETELDFLTIDHRNGDGAAERKQKLYGTTLLNKIIREGYPDRYRVMCFNCNLSAHQHGGVCVHNM